MSPLTTVVILFLLFAATATAHAAGSAPPATPAQTENPSTAAAQYDLARQLSSRADAGGAKAAVEQQYLEVVKWYRKAALQGYAPAQYSLGQLYYDGIVVKKNYKEAFKWFDKAARQDIRPAQFYTGLCYQLGLGTKQNDAEAYFWLTLAQKGGWQVSPVVLDNSAQKLKPERRDEIKKRVEAWKPAPARKT